MSDDRLSDEAFLDELNRVKMLWPMKWCNSSPVSPPSSPFTYTRQQPRSDECVYSARSENDPPSFKPSRHSRSDTALNTMWQSSRQALLICREIIRTERHYLFSLYRLANGETSTPPPSPMLTYLPALVQISEHLLADMEANPRPRGISEAFLSLEGEIEVAFLDWCGVAGGFFANEDRVQLPFRERVKSLNHIRASRPAPRQRLSSWSSKRMNSLKTLRLSSSETVDPKTDRSKPSVRDLAILPTQRVTRYTLLFKGEHLRVTSHHQYKFFDRLVFTNCTYVLFTQKCGVRDASCGFPCRTMQPCSMQYCIRLLILPFFWKHPGFQYSSSLCRCPKPVTSLPMYLP